MSSNRSARHVRPEDLRVEISARPGWVTGAERVPSVGEEVYCTGGAAEVKRVLGKTGNGSRLLELRLVQGDGKPFFVAASNVLVLPVPTA